MRLAEGRGIKTGRWYANELFMDTDINAVGEMTYQNIADLLASLAHDESLAGVPVDQILRGFSVQWSTALTVSMKAGVAVSFSGYYLQGGVWGFSASPGDSFSVALPEDTLIGFSTGGTYGRVDTIEVRPVQVEYDDESRNFKDPITGLVTSALVATNYEYGVEFAVREGDDTTPGSGPQARTAGWIKIAEVDIPAGATEISQDNIRDYRDSDQWLEDNASTMLWENKKHMMRDVTGESVHGIQVGNDSGEVPINNGNLSTDLYAELAETSAFQLPGSQYTEAGELLQLAGPLVTPVYNTMETVIERIFEPAITEYTSATALQNGNALIAYKDGGNSDYGTFVIYDPSGTEVVAPTVFNSAATADISATTLQNGNVLIAYQDGGNTDYGTFVIYNPTGTQVVAPTVFEAASTYSTSATSLQNGNILIAYRDAGNSNRGTFVIYDPTGTEVVAPTVFEAALTSDISVTTLQNGNVLIAYKDVGNADYGTFVIYDPSGTEVVAPTIFESATTTYISATALQNGNVLIAYKDGGNTDYGTFVIYDPSGTEVVAPTVFNSAFTNYISATTLQNGNVLIAYQDIGNSDYGTFVIYNPTGTEGVAPTVFNSAFTDYISATALQNGNVLIAYRDVENSNYGTLQILRMPFKGDYGRLWTAVDVYTNVDGVDLGVISEEFVYFNEGQTWYNKAATLKNGNIVIVFQDKNYSSELGYYNHGNFVICTPGGNRIVGPIDFSSADIDEDFGVVVFNDSRFVIAYSSGGGKIVIYNEDGTQAVAPITFHPSSVPNVPTILHNDNVFIAYRDSSNDGAGTFVIYDSQGTEIVSPTVFEAGDGTNLVVYISASTLQNGNVFISYMHVDGKFVIYDEDGIEVKGPTVFRSGATRWIRSTPLLNGNVCVLFYDTSNYEAYFTILDSSGNEVASPIKYYTTPAHDFMAVTTLLNGNIFITLSDDSTPWEASFFIYSQDGVLIVDRTGYATSVLHPYPVVLQNGNVAIARQIYAGSTNRDGGLTFVAPYEVFQPIGIARNTVNTGEPVYVSIDVNNDQSGLAAGIVYYMQEDGSLGGTETPYRIGRALTSQKILLDRGYQG